MTNETKKEMITVISDEIWNEIKDLPIEMYALPNQLVREHVKRFKADPNAVFLKLSSSAVIASLEDTLARVRGRQYTLERADGGYVVIRRAPTLIEVPKTL